MARRADIFFQPRPGTDIIWLSAMTRYILESGLADTEFIKRWVNKFDEYKESLSWATMEFAEASTGIPADELRRIATIIAEEENVCVLWAMGVTQHVMGSDTSTAISNLLLATGQLHAARHRRLPLARAQQRAGRQRLRLHAQHVPRLREHRRRSRPRPL